MKFCLTTILSMTTAMLAVASPLRAGEADIVDVKVIKRNDGYHFDVSVRHNDTGWDHYADRWDVIGPNGDVLGARVLLHPHENEQPFLRSLSGVKIPEGVGEVTVRAHDKVHGLGGKEAMVELPR